MQMHICETSMLWFFTETIKVRGLKVKVGGHGAEQN